MRVERDVRAFRQTLTSRLSFVDGFVSHVLAITDVEVKVGIGSGNLVSIGFFRCEVSSLLTIGIGDSVF